MYSFIAVCVCLQVNKQRRERIGFRKQHNLFIIRKIEDISMRVLKLGSIQSNLAEQGTTNINEVIAQ